MKHQIIIAGLLLMGAPSLMAQGYYEDDIYYNPKKSETSTVKKEKKKSNYIANMADMDVDAYNRRNQYYVTSIDTIGSGIENGEDFVYTQQIQKYYNPTIVVDNADVLEDVLANSYGNVEIEINANGLPVFTPYYGYSWPYYRNWGVSIGPWGWNVGFYDPWYAWNWGPSWSWGPSWAWGPSWGWGPSWRPAPPMADWRPGGNRPVAPRPGWTSNTRPGYGSGHRAPIGGGVRPSGSNRPGTSAGRPGVSNTRPGSHAGVVNNNGKWEYVNNNRGNRTPVGGNVNVQSNSTRPGYNVNGTNVNNSRPNNNGSGNTYRGNRSANGQSNTSADYNYNRGNNSHNNRSYNSTRTYNTGRGSGGSYGGGSRGTTGGGSRGGRGSRR